MPLNLTYAIGGDFAYDMSDVFDSAYVFAITTSTCFPW